MPSILQTARDSRASTGVVISELGVHDRLHIEPLCETSDGSGQNSVSSEIQRHLLDRSREISSQNVHIDCHSFLSCVRVSVHQLATRRNGNTLNGDNCGHNGDRLSQNYNNKRLYFLGLNNLV